MSNNNRRTVYSTDPEPEPPVEPADTLPANPAAPLPTRQLNIPVVVKIERKGRGGKTVSVIDGVMSPPKGQKALLKLLKNKLGTGGTIKDGSLELQGDRRDDIVAILTDLGYQAKRAGG